VVSLRKERKALKVRGRHYAIEPDPGIPNLERYVEVIAINSRRRPVTVIELGLHLTDGKTVWKRIDGHARPKLPITLADGEIATMTWYDDELGEQYAKGEATVSDVFARDAEGKLSTGRFRHDADADFVWS
jgi:hypothetical protein